MRNETGLNLGWVFAVFFQWVYPKKPAGFLDIYPGFWNLSRIITDVANWNSCRRIMIYNKQHLLKTQTTARDKVLNSIVSLQRWCLVTVKVLEALLPWQHFHRCRVNGVVKVCIIPAHLHVAIICLQSWILTAITGHWLSVKPYCLLVDTNIW